MAAMAMVALEVTIVATAMPGIVTDLGGLHLYAWVFSSFMLAQTATTVVFGKLSDIFGRRPTMLAGIAIFLLGSVLAGFAWSMPSMIAFRVLQGLGAGAILPIALTIVGDMYSPMERGKVQGYLASVWAVSAVAGPMAGSLIMQELSWAWIFWINVPVGLLTAWLLLAFLHEPARAGKRQPIDYTGAVLFSIGVVALMLGLTDAATAGPVQVAVEFGIFVLAGWAFIVHERKVADPMVPLRLWSMRAVAACNAANLLAAMALMGLTTFLPMYLQAVSGQTPVVAGLALTVMSVGWPAGATVCARTFARVGGLRPYLVGGSAALPLGAVAFVMLQPGSSPLLAGAGSLVMGFGMGLLTVASMMMLQSLVAPTERGSVTASNLFARNLGTTLGAALFGAVQGSVFMHAPGGGSDASAHLRDLLSGNAANLAQNEAVRQALHQSLHATFWTMLAISVLAVAAMALVPKESARIAP